MWCLLQQCSYFFTVTEIVTDNEFFDYEAKYEGKSNEITPARIDKKIYSKIKNLTEKIYSELNLKEFAESTT